MKKTLAILAAGIGSRFGGGIKQLEPVGPGGEIIIDYSIHDAIKAGFNKIVFIIRKSIQEKGYDEKLGWFVVYGDDNIIRDGQHRACSLLLEQGDLTVPVIRLYFSDDKPVNIPLRSSPVGFFYHCFYRLAEIRRETSLFSKARLKSLLKKGYFITKGKHRKSLFSLSGKEARIQRSILGK